MVAMKYVICGTDFSVQPYRGETAKCCSRKCVYDLKKRTRSPLYRRVEKKCEVCGSTFAVKRCQVGRYCSNACVGVSKRVKRDPDIRQCVACKKSKSLAEFGPASVTTKRKRYRCKACCAIQTKRRSRTANGRWWNAKAAAGRRGLLWDVPVEEHAKILARACTYCGGPLSSTGGGLDRIDNGKGYSLDNVVPCCGDCNRIRCHLLTYEEMLVLSPGLRQIRAKRLQAAKDQ